MCLIKLYTVAPAFFFEYKHIFTKSGSWLYRLYTCLQLIIHLWTNKHASSNVSWHDKPCKRNRWSVTKQTIKLQNNLITSETKTVIDTTLIYKNSTHGLYIVCSSQIQQRCIWDAWESCLFPNTWYCSGETRYRRASWVNAWVLQLPLIQCLLFQSRVYLHGHHSLSSAASTYTLSLHLTRRHAWLSQALTDPLQHSLECCL